MQNFGPTCPILRATPIFFRETLVFFGVIENARRESLGILGFGWRGFVCIGLLSVFRCSLRFVCRMRVGVCSPVLIVFLLRIAWVVVAAQVCILVVALFASRFVRLISLFSLVHFVGF